MEEKFQRYACVEGKYLIYAFEPSGLEIAGEDESIISESSDINLEILQVCDYVLHDSKLKGTSKNTIFTNLDWPFWFF